MKIAYVVRDINGNGGLQTFAKVTSKFVSKKYKVNMLDWHTPHTYIQEGLIRILPTTISKKIYPYWFKQDIHTILKNQSVDLIHFWHVKAVMATIDSLKNAGMPYVITCHGSEVLREVVGGYQFDKFIESMKYASVITTPSEFTKNYLVNEYSISRRKIFVVSPSIVPFKSSLPSVIPTKYKPAEIGTLTRLVKRKNVPTIIAALNILHKQGVEFRYHLAGNGSPLVKYPILLRLHFSKFEWTYTKNMSNTEKNIHFYPSLDLFVLPPLVRKGDVEGFGIVFLEANTFGIPVVAAKTGGVVDAVKENISGVFANPQSPEDIAEKILEVLKNHTKFEHSSRSWVKKFDPQLKAEEFNKIYKAAIS